MQSLIWAGVAAVVAGTSPCLPCDGAAGPSARLVAATHHAASPGVPSDTTRVRLAIQGMTCGSCATTARLALQRVEGVYRAVVSYDSASAVVWYDSVRTSPERFIRRLRELTGYEARAVAEPARPGTGLRKEGPRAQ